MYSMTIGVGSQSNKINTRFVNCAIMRLSNFNVANWCCNFSNWIWRTCFWKQCLQKVSAQCFEQLCTPANLWHSEHTAGASTRKTSSSRELDMGGRQTFCIIVLLHRDAKRRRCSSLAETLDSLQIGQHCWRLLLERSCFLNMVSWQRRQSNLPQHGSNRE